MDRKSRDLLTRGCLKSLLKCASNIDDHENSSKLLQQFPVVRVVKIWQIAGRKWLEITDGDTVWPGCFCPKTMKQSISERLQVGSVIEMNIYSVSPEKMIELQAFRVIDSPKSVQGCNSNSISQVENLLEDSFDPGSFNIVTSTSDHPLESTRIEFSNGLKQDTFESAKDSNLDTLESPNSSNRTAKNSMSQSQRLSSSFEWDSLNSIDINVHSTPKDSGSGSMTGSNVPIETTAQVGNKQSFTDISSLSFDSVNWTLKVEVRHKSPMITYSKGFRHGTRFTFDVFDSTGEIRIIGFNARCSRFLELISPGRTYQITNGTIQEANKKFNNLNNDLEIVLTDESIIELCENEDEDKAQDNLKVLNEQNIIASNELKMSSSKPKNHFLNKLKDIEETPEDTMVNVIGIIHSLGHLEHLTGRNEQNLTKLLLTLVDQSSYLLHVTLWNQQALNFTGKVGQVVSILGAKVGRFSTKKTLSTAVISVIEVNPEDEDRSMQLLAWSRTHLASLKSPEKPQRFIAQVSQGPEQEHWSITYATVLDISRPTHHFYKSCGHRGCTRKVLEGSSPDHTKNIYQCTSCNRISETFIPRLLIHLEVSDTSGSIWVAVFQETTRKFLGISVKDLYTLQQNKLDQYTQLCMKTFRFKHFRLELHSIPFQSSWSHVATRIESCGLNTMELCKNIDAMMKTLDEDKGGNNIKIEKIKTKND